MKYRAALFDFDGTLAPSLPLWINAYQYALDRHGIAAAEDEILRRCFFRDLADVAQDFGIFTAEEFQPTLDEGLKKAFLRAELFPQARQLVEHCREHGLRTALVTSSPRYIIVDVLERLDLNPLFDFVICGGDVENYKPHPEPVLKSLAALECSPAQAIMIGDSHVDILAGRAAGTRTALFLPHDHHRFHSAEKLRATEPDHIFADHHELPALLELPEFPRTGRPV